MPEPSEAQASEEQPVKQEGSERNPEFLPPHSGNQDTPVKSDSTNGPAPVLPQPPHAPAASTDPHLASSSPQIADDVDLIEKEWVEKAKEIVEKTKENPYLQNKAIGEIKADYIRKRYNKELAKNED